MRRLALLPLLLASTPALARNQAPHAPAISVERLKAVDPELSSDAYEGGAPATPAETKMVAYIVERFQAAGLKPGNHGAWTQDGPMVALTATAVQRTAEFRGVRDKSRAGM